MTAPPMISTRPHLLTNSRCAAGFFDTAKLPRPARMQTTPSTTPNTPSITEPVTIGLAPCPVAPRTPLATLDSWPPGGARAALDVVAGGRFHVHTLRRTPRNPYHQTSNHL